VTKKKIPNFRKKVIVVNKSKKVPINVENDAASTYNKNEKINQGYGFEKVGRNN
jgi:hypothetical protein